MAKSDEVEEVQARQKQSADAKRATFDLLKNKRRAQREVILEVGDDQLSMLFRAIGTKEYDKLMAKCPPNTEQKARGEVYNPDNFAPMLLSAVVIEPELSVDEWKEIWNSPDWSRGETGQLFLIAVQLCNSGFDIPFNESA